MAPIPRSPVPFRRALVLGGASFVGQNLLTRLGVERAAATWHTRSIAGPWDGMNFDALATLPSALAPVAAGCSHAVILLGNTNPDACARDPAASQRLNVEVIKDIIDQLDHWNIMPVFMSTEAVFDGRKGHYTETDPPAPLMTYAAQKVAVEQHLAARNRPYLVVRLARVVGSRRADGTLFSAWLEQIEKGETIRCAEDHVFSPVHVDDVTEALVRLMAGGASGLFHLGGPEALSRLAMLERLLHHYRAGGGTFCGSVQPCLMGDFPTAEPRPQNISLVSAKLDAAIGFRPRPMGAVCRALLTRGAS